MDLPMHFDMKQALLEVLDVARRAEALIDYLELTEPGVVKMARRGQFPPDFSSN